MLGEEWATGRDNEQILQRLFPSWPRWELWSALRAPPNSLRLRPPPPALDYPAGWCPPPQPSGPPLTPPSPPCMLHAVPSEGNPPSFQIFETTFLFTCLFLLVGLLFLFITHTNKMARSKGSSRDRYPLFWESFSPISSPNLRLLQQISPSPVMGSITQDPAVSLKPSFRVCPHPSSLTCADHLSYFPGAPNPCAINSADRIMLEREDVSVHKPSVAYLLQLWPWLL